MSMTREEAIKILRDMLPGPIVPPVHLASQKQEAIRVALAALRGPTREMVERMRGEWVRHEGYDECTNCSEKTIYGHNFCPCCGEPKTDEAVDMVLERWKEALDNDN